MPFANRSLGGFAEGSFLNRGSVMLETKLARCACFGLLWVVLAASPGASLAQPAATTRTTATIADGTPWQTKCFVQRAATAGPTVLVVGGVHGNEPAGAVAANQIRHWPITRGKLIVIPRANVVALAAASRYLRGVDASSRNLNRNFPRADRRESPRGELATAIWDLVEQYRPDWVIDLHEGYDFNSQNAKSVGSTIIASTGPDAERATSLMLAAVNEHVVEPTRRFGIRGPPVNGSLARAAAEHLGARSMILETTTKSQPVSARARQHRVMMQCLLSHLQMIDRDVSANLLTEPRGENGSPRVAVYDAQGTGGKGVPRVLEIVSDAGMMAERLGPEDIRGGVLEQFDLVVFSGGTGSGQANALEDLGRTEVTKFINRGGGYMGICAGSYLACDGFSWGLGVVDARTVSPKWRRGRATVKLQLTDKGREVFGEDNELLDVLYANGPILMRSPSVAVAEFEILARFRTETAQNGSPEGIMVGSPAIVAGVCGKGRVICFSPHPEQTDGLAAWIARAAAWATRQRE